MAAGLAAWATVVPGCPEWSVHDLVAHMAGVTDDVTHGRIDGVGTDPWTAKQVAARKGASLAEMLTEWEANAPAFEDTVRAVKAELAVMDLARSVHESIRQERNRAKERLAEAERRNRTADALYAGIMQFRSGPNENQP